MRSGSLSLSVLLALAAPMAGAAPQDPARVDGSQVADPAAVFASPAPARVELARTRDGGIPPLTLERYRQAYGSSDIRARLGRTYATGSASNGSDWLQQLLSTQNGMGAQDATLRQGMQTAHEAMDAMGRQLLPALRDLKRDFDTGVERASQD